MIIFSLLSWIIASICNSIMDTSSHHYSTSIFKDLNPMWWNGEISWKNKYIDGDFNKGFRKWWRFNYPVQLTDCFHFFKTLMIIFITISIVTFDSSLIKNGYYLIFYIFMYGVIWNITFSLFYDKILRKK